MTKNPTELFRGDGENDNFNGTFVRDTLQEWYETYGQYFDTERRKLTADLAIAAVQSNTWNYYEIPDKASELANKIIQKLDETWKR